MHVHWHNQDVRLTLPPVGSVRLWDTRTLWSQVEPRKGEFDFRRLDKFVDLAGTMKADVLMTFGGTPRWAAARPNVVGPYGPGSSSTPRSMSDWDDYVRAVATRYRGRIKYYEVINEPAILLPSDNCMARKVFYCATAGDLVALGNRTRAVVRAADPSAIVQTPGFVHPHLVQKYIEAGGGWAPVVDIHEYPKQSSAKQAARWREFRQAVANAGKPNAIFWSTEGGLPFSGNGYEVGETYIPAAEQPGAIASYLTLAAATGLERVFYYTWDHQLYGMSSDLGTAPNDAAKGYLRTMTWLLGARISPCVAERDIWRCNLTRGATKATILWYDAPGERTVDAAGAGPGAGFVHRMDGRMSPLATTGLLKIGREPILVTYGTAKWGVEQKFVKL